MNAGDVPEDEYTVAIHECQNLAFDAVEAGDWSTFLQLAQFAAGFQLKSIEAEARAMFESGRYSDPSEDSPSGLFVKGTLACCAEALRHVDQASSDENFVGASLAAVQVYLMLMSIVGQHPKVAWPMLECCLYAVRPLLRLSASETAESMVADASSLADLAGSIEGPQEVYRRARENHMRAEIKFAKGEFDQVIECLDRADQCLANPLIATWAVESREPQAARRAIEKIGLQALELRSEVYRATSLREF